MINGAELLVDKRKIHIIVLSQLRETQATCWHILHTYSQRTLALIGLQVECYIIVHLLTGHTYILLHLQNAIDNNLHLSFWSLLLDGQPQVAALA